MISRMRHVCEWNFVQLNAKLKENREGEDEEVKVKCFLCIFSGTRWIPLSALYTFSCTHFYPV